MSGPVSISLPTHPALFNNSSVISPSDIPVVQSRQDKRLEREDDGALAAAVGQNAAASLNVRTDRPELRPSPGVVVDAVDAVNVKEIKAELIRLSDDSPQALDFSKIRDEKPESNARPDSVPFFSGESAQRSNVFYRLAQVLMESDQKTNSELLQMNAQIRKQANDAQAQSLRDQGATALTSALSGSAMQLTSNIVGSATRMNGLNERKEWIKNDQGLLDELREMKAGVRTTLSPDAAARLNDESLVPTRPRVDASEMTSVARSRSASVDMEPPREGQQATAVTNNMRSRSASMELEPSRDTPPATQETNAAARPRSASAPAESTVQDAAPTANGRTSGDSQGEVRSRQPRVERDGQMPSEGNEANEANAAPRNGSMERAASRPSELDEIDVESPTPLSKDDPRLTRLIEDLEKKSQLVQINAGKKDVIGLAIQEAGKAGAGAIEGVFAMIQNEARARSKISENTEQTMSSAVDQNLSGIQQAREAALAILSRIEQSDGAHSSAFSSIADNLRGA